MATSVAQRVADYRARTKEQGLTHLSLIIPQEDLEFFKKLAAERRAEALSRGKKANNLNHHDTANEKSNEVSQAQKCAALILKRIIHANWPIGQFLGNEIQLAREYKISRAVLRQALRLLERDSIIRSQRGAGGGVFVNKPDLDATLYSMSVYLEYSGIRSEDILKTRKNLECHAIDLVIERLDLRCERIIKKHIRNEKLLTDQSPAEHIQEFHVLLGRLSQDPMLELLISLAMRLTTEHSNYTQKGSEQRQKILKKIKRYHYGIAKALLLKDPYTAKDLINEYLENMQRMMS